MDAPLGDGDRLSSHDHNAAAPSDPAPSLARLWRDRHTLQLGLDPRRAVLLEVANPGAARPLDLLDGAHSERAILDHATKIYTVPTLIAAVGYAAGEIPSPLSRPETVGGAVEVDSPAGSAAGPGPAPGLRLRGERPATAAGGGGSAARNRRPGRS
jgi:hypothetical protein